MYFMGGGDLNYYFNCTPCYYTLCSARTSNFQIMVFWLMAPCSMVHDYQRFREKHAASIFREWPPHLRLDTSSGFFHSNFRLELILLKLISKKIRCEDLSLVRTGDSDGQVNMVMFKGTEIAVF
jgi:hypothetical protein